MGTGANQNLWVEMRILAGPKETSPRGLAWKEPEDISTRRARFLSQPLDPLKKSPHDDQAGCSHLRTQRENVGRQKRGPLWRKAGFNAFHDFN